MFLQLVSEYYLFESFESVWDKEDVCLVFDDVSRYVFYRLIIRVVFSRLVFISAFPN